METINTNIQEFEITFGERQESVRLHEKGYNILQVLLKLYADKWHIDQITNIKAK